MASELLLIILAGVGSDLSLTSSIVRVPVQSSLKLCLKLALNTVISLSPTSRALLAKSPLGITRVKASRCLFKTATRRAVSSDNATFATALIIPLPSLPTPPVKLKELSSCGLTVTTRIAPPLELRPNMVPCGPRKTSI